MKGLTLSDFAVESNPGAFRATRSRYVVVGPSPNKARTEHHLSCDLRKL